MTLVNSNLYRAIVTVAHGKESPGGSSELLDIAFTAQSRQLLRVLSETFVQSEGEFASTLLKHGLSETLKILPDVLADDTFSQVEERVIAEIGLAAYLRLQPVLPYQKGLLQPNFAEVSAREGVFFGKWSKSDESVSVCDIHTQEVLFTFRIADRPKMGIDRMTWEWNGSNVKPLFGEPIQVETLVDALEVANILILGAEGYFCKEDEFSEDLVFSSFENFAEHALVKSDEFKKLFRVIEKEGNVSIEPTASALSVAEKGEDGRWMCGGCALLPLSVVNVIICPEE